MRSLAVFVLLVVGAPFAAAQEPPPEVSLQELAEQGAAVPPVPDAPDTKAGVAPPPLPEEEAEIQPEVVIRKRGSNTVEEYRINGQLYKVKVTPPRGAPYFLMDTDGDGLMDTRRNDLNADMVVPQWVLFRW
ncbi:MAG: DUF2782 domain-containing protein [Pseudomonadota bacterium]|nr:DUF2782 domain-containing protein [Pseudomonadota bacterium]